jgi:hypothetical protein
MSTTRTLITLLTLALVAPTAGAGSQRPVAASGYPEHRSSIRTLSPNESTDTPPERPAPADLPVTLLLGETVVQAEHASQVDSVAASLAVFEAAGLELPGVLVQVWSPLTCPIDKAGSMGILSDGTHRIRICAYGRTIVHELAHVWDRVNLTREVRSRFLVARGLTSWRHDEWHLAAGEHAAEIITWALADTYWPPSRIAGNSCRELAAGYQILTGKTAPILDRYPVCDTPGGADRVIEAEGGILGEPPQEAGASRG